MSTPLNQVRAVFQHRLATRNTLNMAERAMLNDRKLQIKMRRKKNFKKGIQFCLMVCGASGTGKLDSR